MTIAQTIITDALKEIGVLSEGDTPTNDMLTDALRNLNRLLDILSNDASFDFSANEETINLTGQASFTIGPTGNIATSRPIKIESATAILSGITYPVEIVNTAGWDEIALKTTAGSLPEKIWYEGTMSNGIVHVWPQATCTLNMRTTTVVTTFATISTVLSLPPGYEIYLVKALAVDIAPQYPAGVLSQLTINSARNSLRVIKRTNNMVPKLDTGFGYDSGGGLADFYKG